MKIPHFKKIVAAFSMAVIAGVVTFGVTGASSETPPLHDPSDGGGVSPTFTGLNVEGPINVSQGISNTIPGAAVFINTNLSAFDNIQIFNSTNLKDALYISSSSIHNSATSPQDLSINSSRDLSLVSSEQASIATQTGAGIWLGGDDGTEHTIKIDGDISSMNGSTPITIAEDLDVFGATTITGDLGVVSTPSLARNPPPQTGVDLTASGNVSATGTITASRIGRYTWRTSSVSGQIFDNALYPMTASCNAGEKAISCGYTAAQKGGCGGDPYCQHVESDARMLYIHSMFASFSDCTYVFQAETGSEIYVYGQVLCFDPSL